jgi:hypothetical protein
VAGGGRACAAGFGRGPRECLGVSTALEVLACVIRGFQTPLLPSHHSLLFAVLLPLHLPSGMLSMRYSEPVIQQYHQVPAPSSPRLTVCGARSLSPAEPSVWCDGSRFKPGTGVLRVSAGG